MRYVAGKNIHYLQVHKILTFNRNKVFDVDYGNKAL